MADNTAGTPDNPNLDQGKISADAQNIARGQNPGSDANESTGTGTPPANVSDANTAAPNPKAINQPAAETAAKNPVGRPKGVTQGNPGALKPGAVAENQNPGSTRLSVEQADDNQKEQLTNLYGPDFVTAEKNGTPGYFSRRAWDLLGDNKEGWKITAEVPPEVQELQRKQAEGAQNPQPNQ